MFCPEHPSDCALARPARAPYDEGLVVAPDELPSPHRPAPADLIGRASALVREFPECFWFWHPEARVRQLEDVRLVVEHLREYGGGRAWHAAQELHRCFLPLYRKTT
jgi:hypothetical protein